MKVKRKIIEIDEEKCDGCGQCIPACAEGALEIIDGKAKVIADKFCDGLGACLGECPNDALRIVEREAEEFDEEAVEEMLSARETPEGERQPKAPFGGGCPSANVQTFVPRGKAESTDGSVPIGVGGPAPSKIDGPVPADVEGLSHWPVQIQLVPPTAPFLKDANLLIVADCAPVAYPKFHSEFMKDRIVMMGCPKFDDAQAYVQKFTEIFKKAGIRSVTCVYMEVPCCSGLPAIVKKALADAGADIPLEEAIIGRRGERLENRRLV